MTRAIRIVAVLLAALVVQSLVAKGLGNVPLWVDLPLVAVVYAALSGGPVAGLLAGTAAGLAQDAMGGGVMGIGGMSKSIAGFLAGVVSTQFIVTQTLSRMLVFVAASVLNGTIFMALYAMLGLRDFDRPWLDVTLQAAANGLVGAFLFSVLDVMPGARERWRARREYRRRARFR